MPQVIAPLHGIVAATFTPLREDRSLHLEAIAPMVDRLIDQGMTAMYVLGSTGEGASVTFDERCAVAESFVCAADGRLPVIVQVGSTYNFATAVYQRLLTAFAAGDMETVRQEQLRSQAIVRAFMPYGPRGAQKAIIQKAIMKMIGVDCGPSRLPVSTLTPTQYAALERELREIGFFEWIKPCAGTALP